MPDARGKVAACTKRRIDLEKAKKRKHPPAGAGAALAFLLAAVPGFLLAAAGDIYRNDFSTRTSVLPLPGDRWMSYTYDPNTLLYYNYGGAASSYSMWELNEQYQDAWGKAWMDDATMEKSPGFALATDPVHGSPGNYFALFRSSTSRSGCAIQPLHNEFTNGMLRLEVDIRRPAVWGSQAAETHAARVALIYRKRMADPLWWVGINSTDYPVMFGAHWEGGANNKNRLILHYRNGSGQQTSLEPGVSGDDYVCTENWYRWRVYVNLDEQRSNCYIWDAGPDQPDGRNTLADTTATRKVEATGYFFRNPMTDETAASPASPSTPTAVSRARATTLPSPTRRALTTSTSPGRRRARASTCRSTRTTSPRAATAGSSQRPRRRSTTPWARPFPRKTISLRTLS